MEGVTHRRPSLSDPDRAAVAWRRYRRLLLWMALVATIAVLAALAYLKSAIGFLAWPVILATSAGVGLSVMMGAALMGLVFLSSGTGHDEDVADFDDDRR